MLRKCVCWMGAACIVMVMALPVRAEQAGSIRVVPTWGGEQVVGGMVSICRVGQITQEGVRFTDGLANWTVSGEEMFSGSWLTWLSERTTAMEISQPVEQACGAEFTGLSEGLYLVQQRQSAEGFAAFQPFLLAVPENGNWNRYVEPSLVSTAQSPQTSDHPAPIIGAMGLGLSVAILMVMVDERK